MKPKVFSRHLSSVFYAALFSVALPLSAEEAKNVEIHLSEIELQEIFNNPTRSYVYVGKEVSSIADLMEELGKLDDNPTSLVQGLTDHIKKGFNIGNYDAVAQALEEAEALLTKHADALGEEKTADLANTLGTIIDQVIEEKLNIDAESLSFLKDSVEQDATRSCCKPKTHCSGLRLLVIKEKIDVLGKAKFREDVTFKDEVTFEDAVVFEDNITIQGTLSVTDEVIGCDLTVGCNINMNNSATTAAGIVGNVFKGGIIFMHNSGAANTFLGSNAGNFTIITGSNNTGIGSNALFADTTGSGNTAIGSVALQANTTGNNNTAMGQAALGLSTGSNNIGLGASAGSVLATGDDNVYIANVGVATESATTRIGAAQTSCFIAGIRGATTGIADAIAVLIDSAGQLGTISSSEKFKENISNMAKRSEGIYGLRPVMFNYRSDASAREQFGLIAEEVAQVLPEIVVNDENGQPFTVQYHVLPVLLVNEIQKLAARVAALEARK